MVQYKALLRTRMVAAYRDLDENYIIEADRKIREKLLSTPEYKAAKVIYAYHSTRRETDTLGIISAALNDGKTVLLPVITGKGTMAPRRLSSLDALIPGKWDIPVPPESEPYFETSQIDMILVPALAYDHSGFRLGRGGGYYDRLLANCSAWAVGIVRQQQLVRELPREPHDMCVDALVTEEDIYRFK